MGEFRRRWRGGLVGELVVVVVAVVVVVEFVAVVVDWGDS